MVANYQTLVAYRELGNGRGSIAVRAEDCTIAGNYATATDGVSD